MRKLIVPLVAAAALALPASALAWGGHHRHGAFARFAAKTDVRARAIVGLEKLSGTGTSLASTSATATGSLVNSTTHPNGHFSASLSATWSSAQTKSFNGNSISCAPATASITLSNGTSSTNTYTGKTCSWTKNGATEYGFYGKASDGTHAFLTEDGTTVNGAVLSANRGLHLGVFAGVRMGNCDHH